MRRSFLVVVAVILMASIASVFVTQRLPDTTVAQVTQVNYTNNGNFDYLVGLKPSYLLGPEPEATATTTPTQSNPKYPVDTTVTTTAPPTTTTPPTLSNLKYPAASVDHFHFTFTYQFVPDQSVKSVSAQINAIAKGKDANGNPLSLPLLTTSTQGNSAMVNFDLVPSQLTGDIIVEVDVYPTIQTDNGAIYESFTQTLNIKAEGPILEVDRGGDQSTSGYLGSLSYTQKGNLSYLVILKPSSTQGVVTLTPPATTITTTVPATTTVVPTVAVNAVDHFHFTFAYQFVPNNSVKGVSTQISATANGKGSDGSALSLPLLSSSLPGSSAVVAFDLAPGQFIGDIVVEVDVYATVQTDDGPIFESFTQTLTIHAEGAVLEVDGGGDSSQSGNIGTLGYTQNGNLTYSVVLKSSSPLGALTLVPPPTTTTAPTTTPGTTVGPSDIIFINLIDSMDATFRYQFQSDKPVTDLNEQVSVTAILAGKDVWTKSIVVVPQTAENGNFTVSFPIDIVGLEQLLGEIKTETGSAATSYSLTMRVDVHVTGNTDYGPIDDTFSPTLTTSLDAGTIQWAENLAQSDSGSIKTSQTVPNRYLGMSVDDAKMVSFIFMGISFVACVVLLFFYLRYRNTPDLSSIEQEAQKLQKKYGERIAEVKGPVVVSGETIPLSSMEDLVKIADELGKPIFHQLAVMPEAGQLYYVFDGTTRYQYSIGGKE